MKKRPPTEAAPSNLAVQWRLFCYALDSINTKLSIFVANLPSILVSGRIVCLHRLVHIIESVYDDTIFGRGSLDRHCLTTTCNGFVTGAGSQCFRREWGKLFYEPVLVGHGYLRNDVGRRLSLSVQPLDGRATDCDACKQR